MFSHPHLAHTLTLFTAAPDRKAIYSEIFRVLKPGATFAMYEWCMTDKYDPTNAQHNEIKHGVEVGDALPPILTCRETLKAFKDAVR